MSRRQLTTKQHSFLEYLKTHVVEHKVWPTYREIVDHFDYRSPNSVTQNLQALTKKGFLRRDHNGYHLIDRQRSDGTVPVRGVLRGDHLDASGAAERFSLTTLYTNTKGLHAIRLDGVRAHTADLTDAEYVLVTEDDLQSGNVAVVIYEGGLSLRRLTPSGLLEDPDGKEDALTSDQVRILGRYAGHAGTYGVVRNPNLSSARTVPTETMAMASFT